MSNRSELNNSTTFVVVAKVLRLQSTASGNAVKSLVYHDFLSRFRKFHDVLLDMSRY